MSDQRGPRRQLRALRVAAHLSTIGLTLAISIAIGVAIGYYLDQLFGTNWLVIVFTIVGIIAGFKQLIQAVIAANREQEAEDAEAAGETDEASRGPEA